MNRIMNVYYGVDSLPYKDKERTIHFPIIGNAFAGSCNYNKIRFYVQDIGGVNTVTWIAITKLPNGRIIYEPLSTIGLEDDENYVELDISSYYTQVKGDIYISLNGCDGDVTITEDSETHIQDIEATLNQSTIVTTGPIKLPINYAVQRPYGFSFDIDQYQAILNALSDKANVFTTIQVISSVASVNPDNFEIGQLFYSVGSGENRYYKLTLVSGNKTLSPTILDGANKMLRYIVNSDDTIIVVSLMLLGRIGVINVNSVDYLMQTDSTNVVLLDFVNQKYYKAPLLSGLTIGQVINNTYAFEYLEKTHNIFVVYGTDVEGDQTTIPYSSDTNNNYIVQRQNNGQIKVPLEPSQNYDSASKKYVDDKIAEFGQNEFQVVEELPTTGEDGIIYLVFISQAEGYERWIWEDNQWLSLGTTQIDLSDYYTKTQTNNLLDTKLDKKTNTNTLYGINGSGAQTQYTFSSSVTNNAIVQRDGNGQVIVPTLPSSNSHATSKSYVDTANALKVDKVTSTNKVYGTNDSGNQITYAIDNGIAYIGNIVRRTTNEQIIVPLAPTANAHATSKKYVDDSLSSGLSGKQDTLVSGTNIKTLNGTTLLGSGNYTFDSELNDTSTNAVQNKVLKAQLDNTNAQLYQLKLEFYESVVSVESYDIDYAYYSALPLTINSQPIIFSAGMDLSGIKGRSYAYNQLVGSASKNGSSTPSGNTTYDTNNFNIYPTANNRYIVIATITNNESRQLRAFCQWGNTSSYGSPAIDIPANSTKLCIWSITGTSNAVYIAIGLSDILASQNLTQQWVYKDVSISNIAQWFGSDSAIPPDLLSDASLFLTKYYNGDLPYNTGKLIDSKPTKVITHGFNIWDEVFEVGGIKGSYGTNSTATNVGRSKNYIPIIPNETYYFRCGLSVTMNAYFYDNQNNYLGYLENVSSGSTFVTFANARYMRFRTDGAYGTTYKHDICINLSNATLNGTYKPYVENEYALDTPTYRSAGSVKDTNEKANVGQVNLGSLPWNGITGGNSQRLFQCYSGLTNIKHGSNSNYVANFTNVLYSVITANTQWTSTQDMTISITENGYLTIRNSGYNTASDFKTAMNNVYLNYELATPTDQPSTTLPENMSIEQGGSVEIQYDSNNNAPSDMTFEFATNKLAQGE